MYPRLVILRAGAEMKLLVTGGAGFMGSAFVRKFSHGDFPKIEEIVVLDSLTYAADLSRISEFIGDKVTFIHGDIRDQEIVSQVMSRVDACINYAAETHVDNSIVAPQEFISTNILGTGNLLIAAKENQIRKFIQVSTDEVYGEIAVGEWTELSDLDPSSPYSASKLSADLLCQSFFKTYKTPTVVTRSCNNYGFGQNPEKLIPKVIKCIKENMEIPLYGNGMNIREWLHVEEHALGMYQSIFFGKVGQTYNFGSGERLTNLELIKMIINLTDGNYDRISFVEDRKGHDFRYAVDCAKAKAELGFSSNIKLLDGIKEIIAKYI